jgi:cleavage and polyadenylation specificity factor subunit 5
MQLDARLTRAITVHPLSNYSFGHAPARAEKGASLAERMARMQARCAAEGARRSVEGIILVNEHNHPHVLLLQARVAPRRDEPLRRIAAR